MPIINPNRPNYGSYETQRKPDFSKVEKPIDSTINAVASKQLVSPSQIEGSASLESSKSVVSKIVDVFRSIVNWIFGDSSPKGIQLVKDFENLIVLLPEKIQQKLLDRLNNVSEGEAYFLHYLKDNIDLSDYTPVEKGILIAEILNGAYVIIDDGGESYTKWCQEIKKISKRFSSHESNADQYAVRGKLVKECLFSKKEVKIDQATKKDVTWFQLERYPAKFVYHLPHLWTWFLYKISGKNIGPYGSSPHREGSNPLKLRLKPLA